MDEEANDGTRQPIRDLTYSLVVIFRAIAYVWNDANSTDPMKAIPAMTNKIARTTQRAPALLRTGAVQLASRQYEYSTTMYSSDSGINKSVATTKNK